MSRRIDPLIDALIRTEADEVRLVVGERIYVSNGGRRQDIGREPLQGPSVAALAKEVLTPDELLAVRAAPKQVRVEHAGQPFDVEIATSGGNLTMTIRRAVPKPTPRTSSGAFAAVDVAKPAAPRPAIAGGARPIDELLHDMISRQASDLHLTAGTHPVMRIHGEMHFLTERPVLTSDGIYQLMSSIFTEKAKADFDAKHDADFAYEVPGLARFRVNTFMDRQGVGAVLRQIPIEIIPADKLGLPQSLLDLCFLTKGLVVVTGPTGSGKSTTLASMVDYINKNRHDHIITIEDPIEFVHKNIKCLVNQREIGVHTTSFKAALRAALREDPDIVLVGEMRDLETISIAIETAETGHLVFGTLHTTTAVSTVDRIIDQFPTDQQEQIRVMLSESLKGVIAQVLCKKKGGGRVAAMEILLGNNAVASLIREGKTFQIPSIMQTSKGAGMITMNDSLLMLVQKGLVEPKEAWMKAVDKNGLLAMFKSNGIPTQFS
jgi:twitching motility protein PilT